MYCRKICQISTFSSYDRINKNKNSITQRDTKSKKAYTQDIDNKKSLSYTKARKMITQARLAQFQPQADPPLAEVRIGAKINKIELYNIQINARLAQLVRAPRLHRGGQGFESLGAYK